jgi:predicted ATPase/DNA-binding winged helix-turn-helix (wHTH) protein
VNRVISFAEYNLRPSERLLEKDGVVLPLGGRALDILIALTDRAGEIVDKRDLIAQVWPDVTVGDGSLRFHMNGLRKALGDGQGDARFITNVPGRGYSFVAPIARAGEAGPAAERVEAIARPHHLPPRLQRMVGRDEAVSAIKQRLLVRRFVTIVGPGGIGKTTVAVAVADALLESFGNSVYFVDFSPLMEASLVPSLLASVLGLSVRTENPVGAIISFLRDTQTLIVFDCCEHLIEATAVLAEQIFAGAPQAYILATSRESLRVEGEHVYRLFPFDSVPDGTSITAAEAMKYPAVQLFVERAAARLFQFQLLDDDAAAVVEICRRLDGIPLAIELAAGRVDAFGINGIAGMLDDRFALLDRGRRTALPRHQTLRAVLDWSYGLLGNPERLVLHRLSVFVGTFTLEAARAVTAAHDIDPDLAVDVVVNLVSKSLVAADVKGPVPRYRLLDTTRAYALDRLTISGEASACARRHALYYRDFLQLAENQATASLTTLDIAARAEKIGNIRAALQWAFSPDGDAAIGYDLAAVVAPVFLEMSLLNECCAWAGKALGLPATIDRSPRQEMLLKMSFGISTLNTIGNSEEARTALTQALELAETLGDYDYELHILEALSLYCHRIADIRAVRSLAIRGEAVIGILTKQTGEMSTSWMMGASYQFAGDQVSARDCAEAAVRNDPGNRPAPRFGLDRRNHALITLTRALWMLGHPEQAMATGNTIMREARDLRHAVSLCIALHGVISVALWNGAMDLADQRIALLLATAEKNSLSPFRGLALGWSGALALQRGNAGEAIRLLRISLKALDAIRYQMMKTIFLAELAAALTANGQRIEGLAAIEEAIERIDHTAELVYLPELLRTKGDILAAGTPADQVVGEQFLLRALEWAGKQRALSLELRAATSLARLRQRQGRSAEALAVLAPIYGQFTEGFDTVDLRAAKRLLDELR